MTLPESQVFEYPFEENPQGDICGPDICVSSSPNPSNLYCGGSLANTSEGCVPCSDEENNDQIIFLGCNVVSFDGKLGFNGSESAVTVELVASAKTVECEAFTDSYGNEHNCHVCPSPSETLTYTGALGHIYTFSAGTFCFRGILSNHQYVESESGYRYRVTLTDGRQILANVAVIMNNFYGRVPENLHPNLINVLYNLEPSVGDNTCGNDTKCDNFGESGNTHKGIFLKRVLEAIDGKQCQVPITKACLSIDVSKVIDIIDETYRITTTESNVLELVSMACEESGYDFYVYIDGYSIVVQPINSKKKTSAYYDETSPLFKKLKELSEVNTMIDREYGQEMTFNKSKRLIIGDHIRYLVAVEPTEDPCAQDDPGAQYYYPGEDSDGALSGCDPYPPPP